MADDKLYTLTQVAQETNISMPTLQRYKKLYQDRIPSVGSGRTQRYPAEALDVFRELKTENIGRRGRPRKNAAAVAPAKPRRGRPRKDAAKPAARKAKPAARKGKSAATEGGLLTLLQIGKLTKISYPTLLRYVKTSLNEIPHRGTGRGRRFLPEAVDVFKRLREESRRGRSAKKTSAKPAKAAKPTRKASGRGPGRPPKVTSNEDLAARVKELEKTLKALERIVGRQQKKLEKPFRVVLQRK